MKKTRIRLVVSLVGVAVLASACTSGSASSSAKAESTAAPVALTSNVRSGASDVTVDTRVTVSASKGELMRVVLRSAKGQVIPGSVKDGTWTASQLLEPGTAYRLDARGANPADQEKVLRSSFTTQALTKDDEVYPAVAPLNGETVGVGMPIVVNFDRPVKNRELFQQHMSVKTSVPVEGSWNWISDQIVHYRPKTYWPAGTKVNVRLDVNSLPAGDGRYGQLDQDVSFAIGSSMVSTVDVARHTMTVVKDGKVLRTLPVTTGDDAHRTRNGVKVIMEKLPSVDMDAASTGVDADAPDYYNISGVKWAMRLTNSGEFIHAAPWSVASQGVANVSHGCTGLSTANAGWLFSVSKRGDVVKYVNSPRPLDQWNGWTDWEVPWSEWVKGSAIQEGADPSPSASVTPSGAAA